MKKLLISFLLLASTTICLAQIVFRFTDNGMVSMTRNGQLQIKESPVGLMQLNGEMKAPLSSKMKDNKLTLDYEGKNQVVLDVKYRENGSLRLSVEKISTKAEAFVFGPYECPDVVEIGNMVGAAWHADGSVVCIQGLNPKTCENFFVNDCINKTGYQIPEKSVVGNNGGKTVLSCSCMNFTKPRLVKMVNGSGFQNVTIDAIKGPDASITGAAICLLSNENGKELLQEIGKLEIEEGLPHPTINGEWAKTSPHAKDLYLVFSSGDSDAQIRMAEKAGVHWIYFSDPFQSWGHFDINKKLYPGGKEEFCKIIEKAHSHGVNAGFHTLSNFIHTHDPYVSPIPHKELLAFDPTKLTQKISAEDSVIYIADALNYNRKMSLSSIRIGDEIVRFNAFDSEKKCFTGCTRGAFGTKAVAHGAGSEVTHLIDHPYATLFPNIHLQDEMADRVGQLIQDSKVRRISFDGMEGCYYTGHGEYAANQYVNRVFQKTGNELICDASNSSNYRWHAHSYFNWGEPWYDTDRKGGMYNYRVHNQYKFQSNLLPGMLGWYNIANHSGRFEATMPEILEFVLSRNVAFDAGSCIMVGVPESDKMNQYLDMIKMWEEFRFQADIPDEVRDKMKGQDSNWHLEKDGDKWILSELRITEHDLAFNDHSVKTESRSTGYGEANEIVANSHQSTIVIDRSSPSKEIPFINEPFHGRIRVGDTTAKGELHNLGIGGGWFGGEFLHFKVDAKSGDYLEYNGGTTLRHYDADYNLLETIEGKGNPANLQGQNLSGFTFYYDITNDEYPGGMCVVAKHIRTVQKFEISRKAQ